MRVGIITMFQDNYNFGGNLQAFALCKACNDLGYDAEQISYRNYRTIRYKLASIKMKLCGERPDPLLEKRKSAIRSFQKKIPHSRIYYADTIKDANMHYDCFIAGSDQIWNPKWINKAYSLDFVAGNKYKFSYAASIGCRQLSDDDREIFRKILDKLDDISVRENEAKVLLSDLTQCRIIQTLDPTFLLSREEWASECAEQKVSGKYIFCYFLRGDQSIRDIATAYAQKHGLRIVTFPNLSYTLRECDRCFGDERLYDVSPQDFLTLIKNAEYVFTDSFHAVAFSVIFQTQFCVINDEGMKKMADRVTSLLDQINARGNFLDSSEKATVEYVETLPPIDFESNRSGLDEKVEESRSFLKSNLERAVSNAKCTDRNHSG